MRGGKSILLFVLFFISLISFSFVSAVENVSQCTNITSTGIYELNTSLQAGDGDSCLMINASNVVLDCVDYSYFINGTGSSNTSGVGVLDYLSFQALTNITIKNCNITGFDTGLLYSNNTDNSIIFNNSLYDNTYGIILEQTYNVNISKNNITTFSSNSSAILLSEDNSSIIENNNITTSGVFGFGITVFDYSSGALININTITTSNTNATAIMIDDGSFGINLTANTIATLGNMGFGIAFFSSPGSNLLYSNTITTSGSESFGIFLEAGSDYNISSNTITTSGSHGDGINLQEASSNSAFTQNTIQTGHFEACVIHIEMLGNNNTFYDNIFNTSDTSFSGVCLEGTAQINNWNTTKASGTNIIGRNLMGGNFWTNNASTGYSDICIDTDGDYICDDAYNLAEDGSSNIDYLPLANHTNMISGSATLDVANKYYMLNQSISVSGTCFNITANNITLDFNGTTITGDGTGYGVNITGYNDTTIVNGNISNFSNGIYISSGSNNAFSNLIINNSAQDAILLTGATSANNNFTNVVVTNADPSYYDINFSTEGINGTWIIDIHFRNYTFAGAGGLVNFKEPSFGEIRFLEPINGSGTSLYTDVDIEPNSAFVNSSSNEGLNKSADIVLYSITYTDPKPQYSLSGTTYTDCTTSSDPACRELGYSGNSFMFNVNHFTYFRAAEAYEEEEEEVGGGLAGVSLPEWAKQKINSWVKIIPGVITVMKDFDSEIGIKQIQIEVNNEAQNVKITVRKYNNKPANVSVEKTGKVYRYLQIGTENLEGKLEKGIVTIQVEKNWMIENSVERGDVALFKFDKSSEKWNELITNYVDEDDNYYYYDAELTSFSYFAIGEKSVEGEKVSIGEKILGKNLLWLWILIGAVILAAAVAWVIYKRKRKKLFG